MSATIQIAPMALLEAKLIQKLEEKKAQGFRITSSIPFRKREGYCVCCLLGSTVQEESEIGGYWDYQNIAAARLSIARQNALDLEAGFMNCSYTMEPNDRPADQSGPFYQLGLKLRRQYVKEQP